MVGCRRLEAGNSRPDHVRVRIGQRRHQGDTCLLAAQVAHGTYGGLAYGRMGVIQVVEDAFVVGHLPQSAHNIDAGADLSDRIAVEKRFDNQLAGYQGLFVLQAVENVEKLRKQVGIAGIGHKARSDAVDHLLAHFHRHALHTRRLHGTGDGPGRAETNLGVFVVECGLSRQHHAAVTGPGKCLQRRRANAWILVGHEGQTDLSGDLGVVAQNLYAHVANAVAAVQQQSAWHIR